jgi:hypothetical protein
MAMTPEEARLANLAKQKRFHERHPHYRREEIKRAKLLNPQLNGFRGHYKSCRTYELFDPRDPEQFPRMVGYTQSAIVPVWANLWKVKRFSRARWASWLLDLEAEGLEPAERAGWAIGTVVPIGYRLAQRLVKTRVKQIQSAGGDRLLRPDLCKSVWSLDADGRLTRYDSLLEAGRAQGFRRISQDHAVFRAVETVTTYDGKLWFDG